jgi:hypothetical protein
VQTISRSAGVWYSLAGRCSEPMSVLVPTDVLRIFIARCREVLAGGGPEPFGLSYGSGKTLTAMQPNVFPPRSGERETIILRTHGPATDWPQRRTEG